MARRECCDVSLDNAHRKLSTNETLEEDLKSGKLQEQEPRARSTACTKTSQRES